MRWESPEIVEIAMNAEIGGYQSDSDGVEVPGPRAPTAQGSTDEMQTHTAR